MKKTSIVVVMIVLAVFLCSSVASGRVVNVAYRHHI